jgi:hypothetical protein
LGQQWAKKRAIKGLKWAWITSSKKLMPTMGQGKSHQRTTKIGLDFCHYLKQEIWANNGSRERAIKWLKWA